MNYGRIYDNLINRAIVRGGFDDSTVVERHHIIPRCLGGGNEPSNIAILTPEEHYLSHQLLCKMYPNVIGLVYAAIVMSTHNTGIRVNNKIYGWLRRKASKTRKESMAADNRGFTFSGRTHSETSIKKIRESTRITLRDLHAKKIYAFDLYGKFIEVYASLSEAAEAVGTCPSNIKYCCEDKIAHIKDRRWSYTDKCTVNSSYRIKNRKVQTPDGEFASVGDAMVHFGFKSTTAVRRRCISKKHVGWSYIDGAGL